MKEQVEIFVYGTNQLCPSCVSLPSSKETYSWLKSAITRKYPKQPFQIHYIDIFNPPEDPPRKQFAQRIIEEDLFYPVVTIGHEMISEGNPRLKDIYKVMERYGYHS